MLPPSLAKLLAEPAALTPRQVALLLALRGVAKGFTEAILKLVPSGPMREDGLGHFEKAYLCFETAIRSSTRGRLTVDALDQAMAPTFAHDRLVARIWMNASTYGDMLRFTPGTLDIETQVVRLRQGIQGSYRGAEIRTSRKMPDGALFIVPEMHGIEMSTEEERAAQLDLQPDWTPLEAQLTYY